MDDPKLVVIVEIEWLDRQENDYGWYVIDAAIHRAENEKDYRGFGRRIENKEVKILATFEGTDDDQDTAHDWAVVNGYEVIDVDERAEGSDL